MPDFTIDGSPSGIRGRVATMRSKAHEFVATGDALARITTDGWNSRAADRFREKFSTEPTRWRESGQGFLTAASALEAYASALESAQSRARWAEGEYTRGAQVSQQAKASYDADVTRARNEAHAKAAAGQVVTLTIEPFHDPGAAIQQNALHELASAKADLECAAHACAAGVRAGCEAAPPKRHWWESVGAAIGGFLEGAGEALVDLGKLAAWVTAPEVMMAMSLIEDGMSGLTAEEIAEKWKLKLDDVQGMLDALQKDPVEFGKQLGKGMLDWDTWSDDPARALGHLLPDAIIAVLTMGEGTLATRGAKGLEGGLEGLEAMDGLSAVDELSGLGKLDELGDLGKLDLEGIDPHRVYAMLDDVDHRALFAPENLSTRGSAHDLLDAALKDRDLFAEHGVDTPWSRQDLIDKINTPTSQLSDADKLVLNALRDRVPLPEAGDVMQKVLQPHQVQEYMLGRSETIKDFDPANIAGSVTRVEDTAHLATPRELHDGLRLDFDNTPFQDHAETSTIIRFQTDQPRFEVPRNSDLGGNARFDAWDEPFTGNGFTSAKHDIVPEFQTEAPARMRDGAEMWESLTDGNQRLVAVLRGGEWIPAY